MLDKVIELHGEARSILQEARESKNLDAATGAIGAALRSLELAGRFTGELSSGTTVNVALGVPLEVAARRLAIIDDARSVTPADVCDRALSCLERMSLTPQQIERMVRIAERAGRVAV